MREAVPLRSTPPLTDVAGCLRFLADEIEAGAVQARTLAVVWDDPERTVRCRCFGQMPDRFGLTGLLKVAADKASTGAWG